MKVELGPGGFSFKVEYNTNPYHASWASGRSTGNRRGAHLFTDKNQARKFADSHFLREPRIREWREGRWS